MKAVILAAGTGKRMKHLTKDKQKVMFSVGGKNLLERKIEMLPSDIDEVIIIVGYLKDQIIDYFGEEFFGKKITYIEQKVINGTGGALWLCKDLLLDKFMVMNGDDLYSQSCVDEAWQNDWALVAKHRENSAPVGRVEVDENGKLLGVIERDTSDTGLVNTGMYVLQPEIFNYPLVEWGDGEYGLPQTIVQVVNDHDIKVVICDEWHQMNSPEDVEKVEKEFDTID